MEGVLNETTNKIHKHEVGTTEYETICGATSYVPADRLQVTDVEVVSDDTTVSKCGRCFEDGGGY